MGLSLASVVEKSESRAAAKVRQDLLGYDFGVRPKVNCCLKLYKRQDVEEVRKRSGVKVKWLEDDLVWLDSVREARNVVHYGVAPPMANKYEKVAALMIGAVQHLKLLYSIRYHALALVGKGSA